MSLRLAPLEDSYLEPAAELFCDHYRALRERIPELPARYEQREEILPLLRWILGRGPAVAALRRGHLVGFMASMILPDFRGHRTAYSPEWANAAPAGGSRALYQALYGRIAGEWVRERCYCHLIGQLAGDGDALEGWQWLGFGLIAMDAVRSLEPPPRGPAPVAIRRAGPGDVEAAVSLAEALRAYLAGPPIFLVQPGPEDRAWHERWLADPRNALWLAGDGDEVIGCLAQGPASSDACTIIEDEDTTSITRAYTLPRWRGRGIGTALLARALEWAREQGYTRAAVDFEPMNPLAARFWTRHFRPVALALVRHVDERATPEERVD